MDRQIIFMFSGQGSQYYRMGKELYEKNEVFKYWMNYCDTIVSPLIQSSLIEVIYQSEEKNKPFDRLLYTNPALFCVQYSLFNVLKSLGFKPDFLMGYSLGEIVASVISGVVTLEDGLNLVVGLAKCVEEKAPQAKMLAIVNSKKIMSQFPDAFCKCMLTGSNFQESFVVCGLPGTIQKLQVFLDEKKLLNQILPVKYGFHTKLIDSIEEDYRQLVREKYISPIQIPIISSSKTEVIQNINKDYFWEIIRYPIDFEITVRKLLKKDKYIFVDLGPSGTLATFVKYILVPDSGSISLQTINQFGRDLNSIEKLKSFLSKET